MAEYPPAGSDCVEVVCMVTSAVSTIARKWRDESDMNVGLGLSLLG